MKDQRQCSERRTNRLAQQRAAVLCEDKHSACRTLSMSLTQGGQRCCLSPWVTGEEGVCSSSWQAACSKTPKVSTPTSPLNCTRKPPTFTFMINKQQFFKTEQQPTSVSLCRWTVVSLATSGWNNCSATYFFPLPGFFLH